MDWAYAALIIGSLAYCGAIAIDFLNYRTGMTPRIKQVEEGVVDVGLEFATVVEATGHLNEQVNQLKADVQDLRRQKTSLFGRLVSERERKQRLEMAVFRKRLKGRERLLSA